ncbi:hypothetical protein MCA2452 [Methylococcus capsulatus str. Bath]|uniref:CPBP family intramembrane metalloprotease n=1 Tax=Methylococcus capsulatus (strain ATCC 33009 / NCIMB 11132 / Bath) TaxID=243233 RepID=Q604T4_METCA|nr:hypothetical protein MCA2452 [Methylococcus capsulatus str. Bath]
MFEGGLLLLAFGFGGLAGVDPVAALRFDLDGLVYGLAGTLPLYLVFQWSYNTHVASLREIKRVLVDRLGPLLAGCGMADLLFLGFLAGFTEEILFRGSFSPGSRPTGVGWAAWFSATWCSPWCIGFLLYTPCWRA